MVAQYVDGKGSYFYRGINLIGYTNSYNDVNFYRFNAHGDVTSVVDCFGNVVRNYEYDAFGKQRVNPKIVINSRRDDNPFRYCGEYFDDETGFVYLRARYYNPDLQRFLSEDPIKDGLNWYVYCYNNPNEFFDYTGLDPIPKWAIRIKTFQGTDDDYDEALRIYNEGTASAWGGFAHYPVVYSIDIAIKETTSFKYNWTGEHVTKAFKSKVIYVSEKLNVAPDDLMAVMAFESRLRPDIKNNMGYVGLIQFGKNAAKEVGVTREELTNMSAVEQMDYVYKYLKNKLKNIENPTLSDLYMAVLAPARVGLSDDSAVYSKENNPAAYKGNYPLDINGDGTITVGEATSFVINRREEYGLVAQNG